MLFDAKTWETVRQYRKLSDTVACLAYSPDNRHLAAGMFAGVLRLFDSPSPKTFPAMGG